MSVCTGAFKLAKAGLLSGKAATTHHEFLDKLEKRISGHPGEARGEIRGRREDLDRGRSNEWSDLALRVVERYFGREVAQTTAAYMDYQGQRLDRRSLFGLAFRPPCPR